MMMDDRRENTCHRHLRHAQEGVDEGLDLTRGEGADFGGISLGRHLGFVD